MTFTKTALALTLLASTASLSIIHAETPASEHQVSGNIGVYSGYYLRGMTNAPESDKVTMQGGLDYNHASGFYAGYWGSTVDYSLIDYDVETKEFTGKNSFEHDFYVGYNGKITEDLGYTIGTVYYYYYDSDTESDGFESVLGLNYKNFNFIAQTLLEDLSWGNTGDTYLEASYSHALPRDFDLKLALGANYYNDDASQYFKTTEDFGFRHLTVGVTHPLGTTGADMSINYIIGGYDRTDEKQKNQVLFGLNYSF